MMEKKPRIEITYDGDPVLTTAQAAARYGLGMDAMRQALYRHPDIHPLPEMLDGRTKLYLASALDAAMGARPGKGANLRGRVARGSTETPDAEE